MGLSAQLVPPPAVTVDSDGPVGTAIAEATHRHLGPTTPGAAPGGARPLLVLVEPGEEGPAGLAARLANASQTRGQRIWVVVTDTAQVEAVDNVVDGFNAVDAVVVVDHSHPATAGAALAAWTWLRHDAPSMALGTLRDSTGRTCRVATITAQTPAEPPRAEVSAVPTSLGKAEQILLNGAERASALGSDAVRQMLDGNDVSTVVSGLHTAVAQSVEPAAADLLAQVREWGPGDLRQLLVAVDELGERMQPDESALAAAAVTLSKADAAVAQETTRTGFSAMFGRRKRLAVLAAQREEAWRQWCASVATQGDVIAQRRFSQQVAHELPALIGTSDERWQQTSAERAASALARWLDTTVTAAGQLCPPTPTSQLPVSRTWGDARPEVRRHLLVPAGAASVLAADSDRSVSLYSAQGLDRPIALAWLLGLSASSFTPTVTDGF